MQALTRVQEWLYAQLNHQLLRRIVVAVVYFVGVMELLEENLLNIYVCEIVPDWGARKILNYATRE